MLTLTRPKDSPFSEADARLAESSCRTLQQFVTFYDNKAARKSSPDAALHLSVEREDGQRADISVPGAALPLLVSLLAGLSRGGAVAVVTTDTEITTQQAADLMHVSRPYVVKLLDHGEIPSRKVGVRRRVLIGDILRYMEETGNTASAALDTMAADNQRFGLYP